MYHEKPGIENTEKTIKIVLKYAREHGIRDIIIASTTGYTAEHMLNNAPEGEFNIIVVTHNTGFGEEDIQTFPDQLRKRLIDHGIKVLTGTMVLRSLGTAIREMTGYSEQDLIANTLRMFSQGIKVCVEMAAMAADCGLVPFDDVIAIAGTGKGADTACLIKANSSNRFFKIKVKEILIKPKEF
ncbi:MAG: hypothetical protein C0392_11450 [Syntrophus sp. (in: bacteria)]|nr:hypothetical protein [Syntrophus sp. (in: bacteria)]